MRSPMSGFRSGWQRLQCCLRTILFPFSSARFAADPSCAHLGLGRKKAGTAPVPPTAQIEEHVMRFYSDPLSYGSMAELLQEAAARTGFSTSDMENLLDSELTVAQLIQYIDAVVTEQMN
jgi:hypothetical protein